MAQFSFVRHSDSNSSNFIQLQVPNSLTPKLINLDDVYFITMKPFSFHADQHYQIQMVFSDKEKLTDHIIQETDDGQFIQSIELYIMLNKIDVEQIGFGSNFGFAHPSVVCIQDSKNIQILNLDKAEGFNIHQASSANIGIDSDSSFFDITFQHGKENSADNLLGHSIVFHKPENVTVKVSAVFNFLYQYGIEVDIKQLVQAIKKLNENHNVVISTSLSNVVWFIEEHGLDSGYVAIHQ